MRLSSIACNFLAVLKSASPLKGVSVQGWVTNVQRFRKCVFIKIREGSSNCSIQAIVPREVCVPKINSGTAVKVIGNWVPSRGKQQDMELLVKKFVLVGYNEGEILVNDCDLLRNIPHLRPKNEAFASILKLRSHLQTLSHQFFMERDFYYIDTPMASVNDCENAGETFVIKSSTDDDYFGSHEVYLPVSAQLHLEAMNGALQNVYTIGTAFRAEKNHTSQHLAEFRMLEAECAFMSSLEELCQLIEDYVKFVVRNVQKFGDELETSSKLCARSEDVPERTPLIKSFDVTNNTSIPRLTFAEARSTLQQRCGEAVAANGERLSKSQELALIRYVGGPLFVTHFPADGKPFYMKQCFNSEDGTSNVLNVDLLSPFVGELAGGSLRENDASALRDRLGRVNGDGDASLDWYVELRRRGYPQSGGFGLGVERLMQSLLGVENIRDTVAFPRWYKHCKC